MREGKREREGEGGSEAAVAAKCTTEMYEHACVFHDVTNVMLMVKHSRGKRIHMFPAAAAAPVACLP